MSSIFMKLKKMVKFSRFPLEQVICRVRERQCLMYNEQTSRFPQLVHEIENNIGLRENIICYKKLVLQNFVIILNEKDNCVVLKDGSCMIIEGIFSDIENNIYVYGQKYLQTSSFFDEPCESSKLFNIVVVHGTSLTSSKVIFTDILHKCIRYPLRENDKYIIIPLLHNDEKRNNFL